MMLLSYIVEMEMIIWRNFHHRRHRKLSKRDLNVLSNLIHCFDDNDFQKIAEMINSLPQMMSIKVANPSSLTVLTFWYFQWNFNHNTPKIFLTSRWRHNWCDGVSNHQPHHCLLNRYSDANQRKHKASRHWPLCGAFTGDRWIPRTNGQ